ncbi:Hypothetical Protein FCC1311_101492 [Hondaea fermentalgiana]|uniref:ER-bound oxygenase mpaB/mpaB'/Rubber oxygenase catalytic domain-containing protein n=1 Tax=Hondaea fermentalgiana TaxID=2315210 RepID=A0A2R5GSS4_9STRA|nr:Hypothetical Protein FCC1311_101492 [Hondaea fermentalgiana]|eukprot:GBG33926.1 Hypothetical Protein FCC1311_101492 [Hondaea fermentalgiana]
MPSLRMALPTRETWRRALGIVAAGGAVVFLLDCKHAYDVMQERSEASEKPCDPKEVAAVEMFYMEASLEEQLVDNATHEAQAEATQARADEEHDEALYKILRESVIFAAGGRAAMMQLAHPYVAQGISQHSNLKNGVQERFFRTFKYMFAMQYGTPEEAARASRVVRKLHNGVRGELEEDVGLFSKGHKYDAAHAHALLWVYLTLAESSIYIYELLVERLSEEAKDAFVASNNRFAARFFAVPETLLPVNAAALDAMVNAMVHSRVLAVGGTASRIDSFLWAPPKARFWPLMALTRWVSLCQLPPRLGEAFGGRKIGRMERMRAALVLGYVRFTYRLMPPSFRWLTAYLAQEERYGKTQSPAAKYLSQVSARVANLGLDALMPPRAQGQL